MLDLRADSAAAGESEGKSKRTCEVCRGATLKIDLVTDVLGKKIREKQI